MEDLDAECGEVREGSAITDADEAHESWQEWIDERAAIMQFEAGIPPDEALRMAIEMRVEWVCDWVARLG